MDGAIGDGVYMIPRSSVGITAPIIGVGITPERLARVGVLPQKVVRDLLGRAEAEFDKGWQALGL